MSDTNPKSALDRLIERAEQLGGELRVRAHLAGMEAKEAWDKANVDRLGNEFARFRDEMKLQAHLASLDAKDALGRVESRFVELRGKAGVAADAILHELSEGMGELAKTLRAGASKSKPGERH